MSLHVIVGPNCTTAASQCCPLVSHGEYVDGTDGQTDGTPDRYITLSAIDAASVRNKQHNTHFRFEM